MVAERGEFAKSHWIICFKWVPLGKLYVDEKLFKSIPGVDRTEKDVPRDSFQLHAVNGTPVV